ncbi:tagatose 6-phosphate kinase [Pedococcus dokdonensis]|uniref:Tagatose 6-phosphate kinase n=1 Tax=Pedococcus dokdonensis TaxID=443156 RepID=A0A1H0SCY3_9MICO|nr:hexose kinase [Pedococcus dokdonensis]SDP39614.1 tagatose 6-phosphate kinase [Pedococcus dokdonensis]
MIITVTPNAALDVTYEVDALTRHTSHRVGTVTERAGGKGVNVAAVLATMGRDVLVTGLAGGASGARIRADLDARGLRHDFAAADGESRRTLTVVSTSDGDATVFNEPGPHQSPGAWQRLLDHVAALVTGSGARVVVLSGSLPPGCPQDGYAALVRRCHDEGAVVVLDADGDALRLGLAERPDLVKPNRVELTETTGVEDIPLAVQALRDLGARDVVVSAGPDGLTWYAADGSAVRARLHVSLDGNPTGAGDAVVAALAAGLAEGRPREDAVRDAVAWSAAAVLQPVAGEVDPSDVHRLELQTLVEDER